MGLVLTEKCCAKLIEVSQILQHSVHSKPLVKNSVAAAASVIPWRSHRCWWTVEISVNLYRAAGIWLLLVLLLALLVPVR